MGILRVQSSYGIPSIHDQVTIAQESLPEHLGKSHEERSPTFNRFVLIVNINYSSTPQFFVVSRKSI